MKKILVLLAFSFSLCTFCHGQYSVLLNFDGPNAPDGEWPEGSLTLASGKLYGMTYYGGPHSIGNVFSVDTDGNNYKDLFDFNGTNGAYPTGNVTISGSKLYGMTYYGGLNNEGVIFSIDTDGNNYKDLNDFSSANNNPQGYGSLLISRNLLYGMTSSGGINGYGSIFSIDTNGSSYKDLFDFNNINGANPLALGKLTLNGSKFYGTAVNGGTHKCGVIFSIDTNGSNYKILLNFDTTNGSYPSCSLTLSGNKLYGAADLGGAYDSGCIFSIDTNGNGYRRLFDFNKAKGAYTGRTSLIFIENILCGTTAIGGGNDAGVIFDIDTNGSGFTDLFDFNVTDGEYPSGVINCGNIIYGMAQVGGTNSEGVIFRYKQVGLGVNNLIANASEVKIYPNPSNGIFTIQSSAINSKSYVQVYNVAGEQIMNEKLIGKINQINLSNQPQGVYFYRVLKEDGGFVGSGKLIVQQ